MNKSFIIVLGDTGKEFKDYLAINGGKRLLKSDIWLLATTEKHNYWMVDEKVKNLRGEFIHFNNPDIYLIANYKSNSYLTSLEQAYMRVKEDLISSQNYKPNKITVIGVNYKSNLEKMKIQVLQWCDETPGIDFYYDFEEVLDEL